MSNELAIDNQPRRLGAFEKRVHEVDFLRGLLIIIVLIDHLLNNFWAFLGLRKCYTSRS